MCAECKYRKDHGRHSDHSYRAALVLQERWENKYTAHTQGTIWLGRCGALNSCLMPFSLQIVAKSPLRYSAALSWRIVSGKPYTWQYSCSVSPANPRLNLGYAAIHPVFKSRYNANTVFCPAFNVLLMIPQSVDMFLLGMIILLFVLGVQDIARFLTGVKALD